MATLERTYNIPLRKQFMKAPKYRRAKKAVIALREFLARHMKSDDIIIGPYLNKKIWERGLKKPPHHVKVEAVKDEKGRVTAELVGSPKPQPKKEKAKGKEKKAEELQKETEELKEALSGEIKTEQAATETEEPKKETATEKPKKQKAEKKQAETGEAKKPKARKPKTEKEATKV